jgi:threonine dehydrogenase-like Zn-dependent dehydrogenase
LANLAGVKVDKDTVAVVQGLGPVACFAIIYLKAMGVKKLYVITSSYNEKKVELARLMGADEVFCIAKDGKEAITQRLQQENDGLGVDLCFEGSGAPSAVPQGMNILRNRGVYLIPGQYSNSGGIEIQPQMITFKAIQIIGSSQYSMFDVKAYLKFLCEHKEVHSTIMALGTKYRVEDVNQAFEDALASKNIKTVLVK